jgi:hypothetical protein
MNTPPTARSWDQDGATHIDVRGLPAPQPMVQILALLQRLPRSATVVVHHERDPVWLYPELAQAGWYAETVPGDEGEVRLRLSAADDAP